jgi:hypothetical protein
MDAEDLRMKHLDELKTMAKDAKIKGYSKMKKSELLDALQHRDAAVVDVAEQQPHVEKHDCEGGVCLIADHHHPVQMDKMMDVVVAEKAAAAAPKKRVKKSDQKAETVKVEHKKAVKAHTRKEMMSGASADCPAIEELMKKVSKVKLMEYAAKIGMESASKLSKSQILDALIEKVVTELIADILQHVE